MAAGGDCPPQSVCRSTGYGLVLDDPTQPKPFQNSSMRLEETMKAVRQVAEGRRGMVLDDADHKLESVRKNLRGYDDLVRKDCYFVVEDTIVEFLSLPPFPGPLRAVEEFVAENPDRYVIDRSRERYILTHNPKGHLLKIG